MKKKSATTDIKKIFESSQNLHKEKTEIDVPSTIKEILKSQIDKPNIDILKKEIDLKPLTHAFENFFSVSSWEYDKRNLCYTIKIKNFQYMV